MVVFQSSTKKMSKKNRTPYKYFPWVKSFQPTPPTECAYFM